MLQPSPSARDHCRIVESAFPIQSRRRVAKRCIDGDAVVEMLHGGIRWLFQGRCDLW